MKIVLMGFIFIPFLNDDLVKKSMSAFSFPHEDSYLNLIGFESRICIPNLVSMGVVFLLIPFVHLLLTPLYCNTKEHKHKKLCCCYPIKWLGKLFWAFIFGIYIRWFMEVYLLMTIAVFLESREFKSDGVYETISIGISALIIGLTSLFILLVIRKTYELLKHRDISKMKYMTEFFAGIKNKSIPLFYTTAFMFRRTIL